MNLDLANLSLDLLTLRNHYQAGHFTPTDLVTALYAKADRYEDRNLWITRLSPAQLAPYLEQLAKRTIDDCPLYGIPFAIKDNIDLAGVATTAGCDAFAYMPQEHAFVVQQLINAGAIPLGKTNLDQFATGLVGTRSPYGACRNAFDPAYISGGSSSGSAVAVALGLASFSLGTDTAGSGRVPAALNNLVGLKPSRGIISSRGMVPACRTLDTTSIFALTASDAAEVLNIAAAYDPEDSYARPSHDAYWPGAPVQRPFKVAVPLPEQCEFFGNSETPRLFEQAKQQLQRMGIELVKKDFSPFFEAARLLYDGPWVAERYTALKKFITENGHALHPVIDRIITPALSHSAVDFFTAEYRMADYRRLAQTFFADVDYALTPTVGTTYTIDELEADPIALNSHLGYYTNFMNLLDFAAVALPTDFLASGLPWGVTLFGPAQTDRALLALTDRYLRQNAKQLGNTPHPYPNRTSAMDSRDWIKVAVCGAHLHGFPLNHQLTSRRAERIEITTTAPGYRFYALAGSPPARPGLIRVTEGGEAIDVEVWAVPASEFGSFVAGIPAPLGIGKVELANGSWVPGFICEPLGTENAVDITELKSWAAYTLSLS